MTLTFTNQIAIAIFYPLLAAAAFTFLSAWLSGRNAARNARAQNELAARMKLADFRQAWIDQLRDCISELQGHALSRSWDQPPELQELRRLAAKIRLLMSKTDSKYPDLTSRLEFLLTNANVESRFIYVSEMTPLSQDILKAEWEVLKRDLSYKAPGRTGLSAVTTNLRNAGGSVMANEELWKDFEILKASLQGVGKGQARLVAALLLFQGFLWTVQFTRSQDTVELLGMKMPASGLWMIAPAVLTALVLGLIGSMNVMGPVWRRLSNCAAKLGRDYFWTDLDTNKNIIDYWVYLRLWPEGAAEPTVPPTEKKKYNSWVFSYPALILGSTITTALAHYPGAPIGYRAYVWLMVAIQAVFSARIWYRAICRFFVVRIEETEV